MKQEIESKKKKQPLKDITNLQPKMQAVEQKKKMGDSSRALLCSFELIKDEEEDLDEYSDEEGSPAVVEDAFDLGMNDSLTESIVQASKKVGPEHFHPICLLG